MAPGEIPPPPVGEDWPVGLTEAVVAAVPGVAGVAARELDARKATMCLAEGASRRPSPTLGVGKWLASAPIAACCRTWPVAGLRPSRMPFGTLMVQTRPAAMIGGPPPLPALHSTRSDAGDLVARTAITPVRHGRETALPQNAPPPSMSSAHAEPSAASRLPIPPRRA